MSSGSVGAAFARNSRHGNRPGPARGAGIRAAVVVGLRRAIGLVERLMMQIVAEIGEAVGVVLLREQNVGMPHLVDICGRKVGAARLSFCFRQKFAITIFGRLDTILRPVGILFRDARNDARQAERR